MTNDGRQTLYVYNGGFLTQKRTRRILDLAGFDIRVGKPGDGDMIGVWGQSPTSGRGEAVARATEAPVLRVEDAFLRSVLPGRFGEPALGLILDHKGVHFDASTPSEIEHLLATHPLDDTGLLDRARAGIDRMKELHLSKYTAFDPAQPAPEPGYVVVIDQTEGDASVRASGGDRARFLEMLATARIENPGCRIYIKAHPETAAGQRPGHFKEGDLQWMAEWAPEGLSPWHLFEGAVAVYTLSSQLGFEAILAGHKPRVFGRPFYAGWGLTQDEQDLPQRGRNLTRAQLFAVAMILAPTWYCPYRDRLASFEETLETLGALTRAWREDHQGWRAEGMRLWKRRHLQHFFGRQTAVRFSGAVKDARQMVWASKAAPDSAAVRVEDGFLRSKGLGASLVPPLSLVADDLGIYYDPTRESRLEQLINASDSLSEAQHWRAERLIGKLTAAGLTKYNLDGDDLPELPEGRRLLVVGQVEDDASIQFGCPAEATNQALLDRCRAENPDAVLIYKPHPDVEAGLRKGAITGGADVTLSNVDAGAAIEAVDEVWTLTSALGFEALLRGKPVTCLGLPFYAGWGLTRDLAAPPARRTARVDLPALAHAALISYPRYLDPVTRLPCPVEVAVERLASGEMPGPSARLRILSKLQGLFSSYAHLWR
ncbi:capsular polysaccharide biosynthesis protein [Actibacterium pelagium]|uniref:Capsular polysaccharide biosynthesis protein n=1 Tax=Actibacterium pelagium TaxID=2029103 RepID=A0A917ACQ0_9RHOB|nr:capsular polysaccharide biosynthesis protein [Actibacterium pelagium]GGE38603.1 capsular polysaccharide biosynthesis protein [Actibacterium pelagium]